MKNRFKEGNIWQFTVDNVEETIGLGREIGKNIPANTIITLEGEMGAGKTHFSSALGFGLGIEGYITSPTFTVINEYTTGRLPFWHMDLYRIGSSSELYEYGIEDCLDGAGVCCIEWSENLGDFLPAEHLSILIEKIYLPDGSEKRKYTIQSSLSADEWLQEVLEKIC